MAEAYRAQCDSAWARVLPAEGTAAGLCRLDRHGQCQPSRALDPSDASASRRPSVIIHNAEFARHAVSEKGDQAVIDGAKSMAMTALDLMGDAGLLGRGEGRLRGDRGIVARRRSHTLAGHASRPYGHARMRLRVNTWLAHRGDQRRAGRCCRRVRRARALGAAGCACACRCSRPARAITCTTRSRSGLRRLRCEARAARAATWSCGRFSSPALFSSRGSLYLLALTGERVFAFVTPVRRRGVSGRLGSAGARSDAAEA